MDMFDFRARNYMNPSPSMGDYGSNFNVATGAGPWATPNPRPKPFTGMDFQGPQRPEPTPYTGIEIQGPMRAPNSFAQAPPVAEPAPFRGMEVQGPLGSTPGRPNYEAPEVEQPDIEQEETPKEFDIFEAMYKAPTPALEAYKRHIMSMPKQEDYRAGKMDRFIAGLTGAAEGLNKGGGAGYAAARGVVDQKYNAALQNYANQGQGLGQLAELESNDMKSKMDYAKTMMEQRRANTKEAREGRKADADIKLTEAQEAKMRADLGMVGKELETSSADGQLYVVDKVKGTRTAIGKFKLTAEEEAEIARKTHKINAGVNFGNDKAMAGVRFGFDKQMAGVNLDKDKALALFKAPLEVQTSIDKAVGEYNALQPSREASQINVANAIRDFAARNPIPSSGFDRMQPSQTDIAYDSAIKQVAMKYPAYMKFVTDSAEDNMKAAKADEAGYQDFLTKVESKNNEIVGAAKPKAVGGTQPSEPFKPTPFKPAVAPPPKVYQSPISAPSAPDDPLRAQAIELIKTQPNLSANDEGVIEQVMEQLRRAAGK